MTRCVLMAIQRNEGMFLLEWLAHNYAIGIDHAVIATNDCEDGSDALLDAVARHFPLTRIDNSAPEGDLTVHRRGNLRMLAHPEIADADWVLHVDVDEFVNVRAGDHGLRELIGRHDHADAIAMLWKIFGDNGRRVWDGGLVTEAFWTCESAPGEGRAHKSLFRPGVFGDCSPHMPKDPGKPPEELVVVNARGERLPVDRHYRPRRTAYDLDAGLMTWDVAFVNHYQVKSSDLSLMKLARGAANGRGTNRRRPGSPAHARDNRNEAEDRTILDTRARRMEIYHAMMSVPEIEARHLDGLRWYLDRRPGLRAGMDRT